MIMNRKKFYYLAIIAFLSIAPYMSYGQAGFHVGVVHPMVTFSEGESVSISDNYVVGFPVGINFPLSDKARFDAEFVPFHDEGKFNNLLIHPGVLLGLGNGYTFGTRLAYETGPDTYGFTPLLNKGFDLSDRSKFFVELVLPVRFGSNDLPTGGSDSFSAFTIALHTGIAF